MTVKERIIDLIEKRITDISRVKELYKNYPEQVKELEAEKIELEKLLDIVKNKDL
jgi:hypothetical protein